MPRSEEGTAVESRKPEILFRNMLQITNGRKWFLIKITNGNSAWLAEDADGKKMIKSKSLFIFRGSYAKGSSCSLCTCPTIRYLQHFPKKNFVSGFRLLHAMPSSG
jgi:hypothetical protein